MAPKPEANSIHVPGSGTTPGPPPQAPVFFLPASPAPPTQQPVSAVPFLLTGAHRPAGNGGGETANQLPPTKGSYKLRGPTGPTPGACGRSSSADWKGTAGECMAVPSPARTGSSNFWAGGSTGAAICCGASSTRLAQRVRAVIRPSVINFSPL